MIRAQDGEATGSGKQPSIKTINNPHASYFDRTVAFMASGQASEGEIYTNYVTYTWHSHPEHYGTLGAGMPSNTDLDFAQSWFQQDYFVLSPQDNKVFFYNYQTKKGDNIPFNSGLGTREMGGFNGSFPLDLFYCVGDK
jgi:hypothetical protein